MRKTMTRKTSRIHRQLLVPEIDTTKAESDLAYEKLARELQAREVELLSGGNEFPLPPEELRRIPADKMALLEGKVLNLYTQLADHTATVGYKAGASPLALAYLELHRRSLSGLADFTNLRKASGRVDVKVDLGNYDFSKLSTERIEELLKEASKARDDS